MLTGSSGDQGGISKDFITASGSVPQFLVSVFEVSSPRSQGVQESGSNFKGFIVVAAASPDSLVSLCERGREPISWSPVNVIRDVAHEFKRSGNDRSVLRLRRCAAVDGRFRIAHCVGAATLRAQQAFQPRELRALARRIVAAPRTLIRAREVEAHARARWLERRGRLELQDRAGDIAASISPRFNSSSAICTRAIAWSGEIRHRPLNGHAAPLSDCMRTTRPNESRYSAYRSVS